MDISSLSSSWLDWWLGNLWLPRPSCPLCPSSLGPPQLDLLDLWDRVPALCGLGRRGGISRCSWELPRWPLSGWNLWIRTSRNLSLPEMMVLWSCQFFLLEGLSCLTANKNWTFSSRAPWTGRYGTIILSILNAFRVSKGTDMINHVRSSCGPLLRQVLQGNSLHIVICIAVKSWS
jgi:hypothetical protein